MKKIIIAILVVSILTFALTACGNNKDKNNGTSTDNGKVTDKVTDKPIDKVTDKVTEKPSDTSPMLDPDDGKISDTDTESSMLDPIESGIDDVTDSIDNAARRMTGK